MGLGSAIFAFQFSNGTTCTFQWVNNNPQILWCGMNSNVDQGIIFWIDNVWKMWETRKLCGGTQIVEKYLTSEGIPYNSVNPFYITTFPCAFYWNSLQLGITNQSYPHLYITNTLFADFSLVQFPTYVQPSTLFPEGESTVQCYENALVTKIQSFDCQPQFCIAAIFR